MNPNSKKEYKYFLFFIIFAIIWYYIPLFTNKEYFFADYLPQYKAWWSFAHNAFKNGRFPFWNPCVFGGMPYYTNPENSLYYPFKLLFFMLPFSKAVALTLLCNTLVSLFGMFYFLKYIKLENIPSLFGAIIFAFGSTVTDVVPIPYLNTICWVPLQLLTLMKLLNNPTLKNCIILSILEAIAFFGGTPEVFLICNIVLLFYLIYHLLLLILQKKLSLIKKILLYLLLSIILFIGLTAIQLFPTLEFIKFSAKSGGYNDPTIFDQFVFRNGGIKAILFPYLYKIFGAPYSPSYAISFVIEPYFGVLSIFFVILAFKSKKTFFYY